MLAFLTPLVALSAIADAPAAVSASPSETRAVVFSDETPAPADGLLQALLKFAPKDTTADLGLILRDRPTHIGALTRAGDVVPYIEIKQKDNWQISLADGAKWTVYRLGPVDFGAVAEYRQSFSNRLPRGAHKMADAYETGGFVTALTDFGLFDARLRRALTGYQGWSGEASWSVGGEIAPKLEVGGSLEVDWADSNFSNEYFGLRLKAARRTRLPVFLGSDYYTFGPSLGAALEVADNTRLIARVAYSRIYNEDWASPLLQTHDLVEAEVGVVFHFKR